jgi:hypothetical protein
MRPNDGKPTFTVETEFDADNWHAAWQHCMGLGTKFNAVVLSHRLNAKDEAKGAVKYLPPPAAPAKPAEPTVPEWATKVSLDPVAVLPWPATLTC